MFFILGEHLGTDIPGVLSLGDDKHSSLHHHGKTFAITTQYNAQRLAACQHWIEIPLP